MDFFSLDFSFDFLLVFTFFFKRIYSGAGHFSQVQGVNCRPVLAEAGFTEGWLAIFTFFPSISLVFFRTFFDFLLDFLRLFVGLFWTFCWTFYNFFVDFLLDFFFWLFFSLHFSLTFFSTVASTSKTQIDAQIQLKCLLHHRKIGRILLRKFYTGVWKKD